MSKKAVRGLISLVVIAGALSLLLFFTMSQGAQEYKHVDEISQNPQAWYGKSLQVHGFVVEKTVMVRPNSLDYRFDIQNNGKVLKAVYTGAVPDNFKGGSEVVLKGRLGPDGFTVEDDGILAKCPSKYTPSATASASPLTR